MTFPTSRHPARLATRTAGFKPGRPGLEARLHLTRIFFVRLCRLVFVPVSMGWICSPDIVQLDKSCSTFGVQGMCGCVGGCECSSNCRHEQACRRLKLHPWDEACRPIIHTDTDVWAMGDCAFVVGERIYSNARHSTSRPDGVAVSARGGV